ncbi:MAG: hypothetical protein ACM3JI_04380 [Anaerolineae bacterium]
MSYDAFLTLLTQLAGQKKARVVIQGSVIFIETMPQNNRMTLSTKVFSSENGFMPRKVRECISSSGFLKWQERGAYLKLDSFDNSVTLIQEIESSTKYVPFKYLMSDFVEVANEWKEILDDFAQRDHIPTRLGENP